MKRMTITVSYEQEKLKALQFYAGKNGTSLESDLDAFMEKLYKKYVPSQTRASYSFLGSCPAGVNRSGGKAASSTFRLFAAILKDSTSRASSSFRTKKGS
jgi:hypothetical protein